MLVSLRLSIFFNSISFLEREAMADAGRGEATDFLFCSVCRKHHQLGKKHKYSAHHKKLCKDATSKYKAKIKHCLKYFEKPEVIDGELEPDASFWCKFCEKRIHKHISDRIISITYGGLFEHLSSSDHHKKIHKFWKTNGGDKKDKGDFWLKSDAYSKYKAKCQECLEEWSKQQEEKRSKAADDIKRTEFQRAEIIAVQHQQNNQRIFEVITVNNSHGVLQNPTGWHNGVRVWRGGIVRTRPKQTSLRTQSRSEENRFQTKEDDIHGHQNLPTLSCVSRITRTSNKGNIHTGAIPPWLRQDGNDNETTSSPNSQEIGPSIEDFKKHVDKHKKKKSNQKRVGANFDRKTKKDAGWLPSFGGVWNSGPRWHSRREFRQRQANYTKK